MYQLGTLFFFFFFFWCLGHVDRLYWKGAAYYFPPMRTQVLWTQMLFPTLSVSNISFLLESSGKNLQGTSVTKFQRWTPLRWLSSLPAGLVQLRMWLFEASWPMHWVCWSSGSWPRSTSQPHGGGWRGPFTDKVWTSRADPPSDPEAKFSAYVESNNSFFQKSFYSWTCAVLFLNFRVTLLCRLIDPFESCISVYTISALPS